MRAPPASHARSRRRLRAFAYTPRGLYREILPREAIDEAFESWEELLHDEDPEPVRRELRRVRRAATVRASRRAA